MKLELNVPAAAFLNLRAIIDHTAYDEGRSVEIALEMAYHLYRWYVNVGGIQVAVPCRDRPTHGYIVKLGSRPFGSGDEEHTHRSPLRVDISASAHQGLVLIAAHFNLSHETTLWLCLQLMADIVALMRKAETRNIIVMLPDGRRIRGDLEHPPHLKPK